MKGGEPAIASWGRGRTEPLTIPLVVFLLGMAALGLLGWKARVNESQRKNFARMDAIMDAAVRASTFHFELEEWLEEEYEPVRAPRIPGSIWHELELALYFSQALVRGGETVHGQLVVPLDEPGLRTRALALQEKLQRLRSIALARLENPAEAKAGSTLDGRFDAVFRDFKKEISALEDLVEKGEVDNQVRSRRLTALAFALWTLIIGIATVGLFSHQRRRVRAEIELRKARAALEEANRELATRVREKTESLQTANTALTEKIAEFVEVQGELFRHQERLRALSSQLTLAEERERRRIAVELHDRIGTGLAFAKIKLASVSGPDSRYGVLPEVEEGLKLVDQAMEDARTLTFELSSPILYELGLEAALEWLSEKTQKEHGLAAAFESRGLGPSVPEDLAVLLFQAVRELLANVVKHAGASNVRVTCEREEGDVRIAVEDDGRGFDAARSSLARGAEGGFGLFSIRERLGSVGGLVEIDSCGPGTRVTLVVPLESADYGQ